MKWALGSVTVRIPSTSVVYFGPARGLSKVTDGPVRIHPEDPAGVWSQCSGHFYWFLLMQRISCSTLNFSEIVKILSVSLRMSPDTLRRKLISLASIWDLILSVTCQKPVTRGRQLECKCSGKVRALPSGWAASSPHHSGTTKPPQKKRLAARQLRHYSHTAATSNATWWTAALKAVFIRNHQKRSSSSEMANQHT